MLYVVGLCSTPPIQLTTSRWQWLYLEGTYNCKNTLCNVASGVLSDLTAKGGEVFVKLVASKVRISISWRFYLRNICWPCGNHEQEASVNHLYDAITRDVGERLTTDIKNSLYAVLFGDNREWKIYLSSNHIVKIRAKSWTIIPPSVEHKTSDVTKWRHFIRECKCG